MSDATARVGIAYRRIQDNRVRHSWGTLTSALQTYVNAMVGLNAGYLAKFDDTASLKFFGLIEEDKGNPILPNDGSLSATAGAANLGLNVIQPPAFEIAISGVAITDIGRRVYALDDQTGTLSASATTFANLIGTVKDLVYATDGGSPVSGYALVAPVYSQNNGDQLQVFSTSTAIQVKQSTAILTGSSALAMTLAAPVSGAQDGLTMTILATGSGAHTVTTGASAFNGADHIATFGGAAGDNIVLVAYAGVWYQESEIGITLS
jgi:hypothetical protein